MAKGIKSKRFWVFLAPRLAILCGIGIGSFCFFIFSANSASAHNVAGWAWSDTTGWISFNCANQGSCSTIDYGVDINSGDGKLSGWAWSENIGWIKFNPSSPFPANPQESARLDFNTNTIVGWARACSGTVNGDCNSATVPGWDGWIKMSGDVQGDGTYGVISTGCFFSGYAWAGDVGWISFRGTAQTGMEYGVSHNLCPNPPPMASGLSDSSYYCTSAPYFSFSWQYSDPDNENEKKFEFQVDDNNDFSSPAINRVWDDLNYSNPAANSQSVLLSQSAEADKLAYDGRTYYWRVRVWDNGGISSLWTVGQSFTLPVHAYPAVNFVWAPLNPGVGEETQFLDESQIFGGTSLALRQWIFPPAAFITDKTAADMDPKVKFTACGVQPVSLRIDDSSGYSCALNQTVNVKIAHCWTP